MMDFIRKDFMEYEEKGIESFVPLARKNNSIENYNHELLSLYIDKIDLIISLLQKQPNISKKLLVLLTEYPNELRFCNQLFEHRKNPEMNLVFLYVINAVKPVVLPLITIHLKKPEYVDSVWMTTIELWFSKLDVNNINLKHLKDISVETGEIINRLNNL